MSYFCPCPGTYFAKLTLQSQLYAILLYNIRYCSFHVGLNCQSPNAYEVALESSAELFAYASDLGFQLNLLDIGGGFTTTELFETVATGIKTALNTYFSSYPCVKVIAEPGITQ